MRVAMTRVRLAGIELRSSEPADQNQIQEALQAAGYRRFCYSLDLVLICRLQAFLRVFELFLHSATPQIKANSPQAAKLVTR